MRTVLTLRSVSKWYALTAGRGRVWRAFVGKSRPTDNGGLWALRDLDLTMRQGEAVGIVGHNGAGKTTLLKLISRVTRPTSGTIEVAGRVSSLIELGAGFHPELTGRENVMLNGTILGMSRTEVIDQYQSIVDFAEIKQFMDVPVKRYSSGMYARLGFSVAVHTRPDILLVDEVLSVGDANFGMRCIERMRRLRESGTTILLVSHNLSSVQTLCDRALWINHGQVAASGTPRDVISDYLAGVRGADAGADTDGDLQSPGSQDVGVVHLVSVKLKDTSGLAVRSIQTGDPLVVACTFDFNRSVPDARFWFYLVDPTGNAVLTADMRMDGVGMSGRKGRVHLECVLDTVPLNPRCYSLMGGMFDASGMNWVLELSSLGVLEVEPDHDRRQEGDVSMMYRAAPVHVPHEWDWRYITEHDVEPLESREPSH